MGVEDVFNVDGHRGGLGSRVYNVDTDKISVLTLTRRCIVISFLCLLLFLAHLLLLCIILREYCFRSSIPDNLSLLFDASIYTTIFC